MPEQKEKLLQLLEKNSLRDFIIWLDIECCKVEQDHFLYQAMARGIIVLGYELLDTHLFAMDHPVRKTIYAAENYALTPTEQNWDELQIAATDSYPFGPGDGCFSLPGSTYQHGEPGDGCSSCAGSLASQGIPEERVMELLRQDIIPWLKGQDDPVILRERPV